MELFIFIYACSFLIMLGLVSSFLHDGNFYFTELLMAIFSIVFAPLILPILIGGLIYKMINHY